MKREMHYCDVCKTSISHVRNEGDITVFGIHLVYIEQNSIQASLTKIHSCGSSGKAEGLHGKEFCSYECFEKSMLEWLAKIKDFFK